MKYHAFYPDLAVIERIGQVQNAQRTFPLPTDGLTLNIEKYYF